HTYMWINADGERFWVKYHFKTDQGVRSFTAAEARGMAAEDPDFHVRDLYESIERGEHPTWRLEMQVMPFEAAEDYRFNPFDLTKVWPHGDYPPMTVGRLVLDANPENYFAEVEQAAFEPANMVPGIGPSPDKMLLGRLFSYPDTHRHRIGTNYLQLPINRPRITVNSYNKDGAMRYRNCPAHPVYAPNSYGGPDADTTMADPSWFSTGDVGRYPYAAHRDDDDFVQPGALWRDVLSESERAHLVSNIVIHLGDGVESDIQARAVEYWRRGDPHHRARVAKDLRREG
ncbi:MAG: Catalase, partial [Acidimicrobiales bacterium]|nr:Catalase [Acidimicrobiales bacterium]